MLVIVVIIIGFNLVKRSTLNRKEKQEMLAGKNNKLGVVEGIEYDHKSDKYIITIVFQKNEGMPKMRNGTALTDTVTITVEKHLLRPVLKNYEIPENITALKDVLIEDTERVASKTPPVPTIKSEQKTASAIQPAMQQTMPVKPADKVQKVDASGIVFKVQFVMSKKELGLNDPKIEGISDVTYYKEGGFYKYTAGNAKVFKTAKDILDTVLPLYPEAFIIAFNNNERIPVLDAKKIVRDSQK